MEESNFLTKAVESGITLSKLAIEFAGQASMCVGKSKHTMHTINYKAALGEWNRYGQPSVHPSMPDQSKFASSTTVLHNIAYTSCMLVCLINV